MKRFILESFIVTIALFAFCINFFKAEASFSHKCIKQQVKEDYSKVHIPIRFMPGQKKCLKHKGELVNAHYYRNLKKIYYHQK